MPDRFTSLNFGVRGSLAGLALAACALAPAAAQEGTPAAEAPSGQTAPAAENLPSFAELEAAGAVIGEIRVLTHNIFDLENEHENNAFYRAANAIHFQTRAGIVREKLLFRSGERVSVHAIEETERLLRSYRIFYDVSIVPVAVRDGVVDIEVRTRDTWTLQPGFSASRSGGSNRTNLGLTETNAFGTGVLLGVNRFADADRTGVIYQVSDPHAFDGWTTVSYAYSRLSDGQNRIASVTRPFYALDTRWAAGITASTDNRLNKLFENGSATAQFRHRAETADAFGGLSQGLVGKWVQRYSIGLTYQKDAFSEEAGLPPPNTLPPDQKLVAPYLRYELVQDAYERYKNLDLIERPEYFVMGLQSSVQLGRSSTALGSTQQVWLYNFSVSDGYRLPSGGIILSSVSGLGQTGYGPLDKTTTSSSVRFYSHPDARTLVFFSLAGDILKDATSSTQLVLGGDTGLRGYPRNYQSGDYRAVFNAEYRVYTDWYPVRLFRVGGAVFYDLGRAGGGPGSNTEHTGWLRDVGIGLRILNARTAFGNVLHLDLAFPLTYDPNIRRVQFLVQTQTTF